jgi:flagellar biosynthesis protein FlhF
VEITALASGPLEDDTSVEVAAPVQPPVQQLDEMRQELAALKTMLGWLAPGLDHHDKIVKNLMGHGLGPDLIAKLSETMKQEDSGDDRERWFRAITRLIPAGGQIRGAGERLALIGPTGVGKTTSLIKLTLFETQRRAHRVGWISTDDRRLANGDPLAVYAGILGVHYEKADTKKELKDAIERLSDCDIVLIDTPGLNPRDAERVKALAKLLQGVADMRRALLLSAVTNGGDLADWIVSFQQIGLHSLFFTKLDECRYFGPLLHATINAGLPISYISLGQNLAGDLEVARPEVFASLLLTGVEFHD